MYHIIAPIAQRAHASAVKRGKDVSATGCLTAAGNELREFWAAMDQGNKIADPEQTVKTASEIQDDAEFTAFYDAHIHNTAPDEMADMIITAATWYWSVGEEEGVIEEDENKIIRNVMRLDEVKASDVMTPRVVAAIAPESMTLKDYYDNDDYDHFSRIPVYSDSPEYITGYVMRDDALEDLAEDHFDKTLSEIKRPLLQFNEEMSIGDIFDRMLKEKSQIGVVIDEYGCFQGILTLEDVIETIFGLEIIDENDEIADMQQYARERWRQRQSRFRKVY